MRIANSKGRIDSMMFFIAGKTKAAFMGGDKTWIFFFFPFFILYLYLLFLVLNYKAIDI